MHGIKEYLDACRYRKGFLSNQLEWLAEERETYDKDAQRLEGVRDRIRQETVGYLLPEVHDEHLDSLEARLSYPGLRPIKRKYDSQFDEIETRRTELAAMDEIQFHDFQLDQATKEVEEVRPAHDEFRRKVSVWENSKWYHKLNRRGYFQLGYSANLFFRFLDWRAVSLLMAELSRQGGQRFSDPESLRVHYRALREEADSVFDAYAKRTGKRDKITGLKDEYDSLLQAPERLLSELYRELGKATLEHLQACPEDLRLELARGDHHLNAFLKKEAGVQKQIQYLRELAVTRIDSQMQQVKQEVSKINSKIQKLELQHRRGKRKFYWPADIERIREVKADKWEKRREKTRRLRDRIVEFDQYDRGSIVSEYLWWDLVTGGARGDDLFEVRDFHQRHPDWNYKTYRDPADIDPRPEDDAMDDAAAALAASMMTPDDDVFLDAT